MNSSVPENVTVSLLESTTTDKPMTKEFLTVFIAIMACVMTLLLVVSLFLQYYIRTKRNSRFGQISNLSPHLDIPSLYPDDQVIRSGPYGQDDTSANTNLLPADSETCISTGDVLIDMGTDYSDGQEMVPVVFQVSSYNPHSATERTGDGCLETVAESETINEVCNNYVSYSRRSVMALVKAPTGNSATELDETSPKSVVETEDNHIDYDRLNWHNVFRFLTKHIDSTKWRLFFNDLYSHPTENETIDVSVKLSQVENDTKQRFGGSDTVSLLLEQFKAWKQFAGRNAKISCIYDALQGQEWNDTLDKFRAYMRNPPMLTSSFNTLQNTLNQSSLELQNSTEDFTPGDLSLQQAPQIGTYQHVPFQNVKVNRKYEESYSICYSKPNDDITDIARNEPDGARANSCKPFPQEEEHTALKSTIDEHFPDISAEQCGETKESRDEACSSSKQKQAKSSASSNKQKGNYSKSNRIGKKTFRKKNAKLKKLQRKKLSKKSFITIVKILLQSSNLKLERDMYQIFLRHLISNIVKETRYEEHVILSLTCAEFAEYTKSKSSREDVVIMYSGSSMVVLKISTFEELLVYKDHAREQVVNRLGENIDQDSQKYLFIDFNGNSFLEKETEGDKADETDSDVSSCLTVEEESAMSEEEHNEQTDVLMSSNSGKLVDNSF